METVTYPCLLLVLVVRIVRQGVRIAWQGVRIAWQARRDIIDVRSRIVLEIVHRVDAAARTFLDRSPRFVVLLRAFLVSQSPGRRRGTEVRAAIPSASSRWSSRTAWSEATAAATATRTWAAEAATAAAEAAASGTWATEAATAGARPEASRPWWARRAILSGARFADGERPALERLRVKLANDFFCLRAVDKLDERKSARTTGLAIDRHGDVGRLCNGCKVGAEISLARTVGEVADEQTDCQGLLVKSPLLAAGFDSISKTAWKSQRAKVTEASPAPRRREAAGVTR